MYYRRTLPTTDADAQQINLAINQILHRIEAGKQLKQLLAERFDGDVNEFKRWARCHIDCSSRSVARFMRLADHEDLLTTEQLTSLRDAYHLLALDSNVIEIISE